MASKFLISLLLILTSLLFLSCLSDPDDLLSELRSLRSQSESGVIHLNDQSVARFILNSASPRPYSIVIFFDAAQLQSKPDLHLPQLRSEFALVSSSFLAYNAESGTGSKPDSDKVFFCDLEFGESQHSFSLFGVNSLPHIRHVGPATKSPRESEPMEQSEFAGLAESMSRFVETKARVSVGPIVRPPPVSTKQIVFLLIAFLMSAPYLIKRVLAGDTMVHDPKLWMSLAVFVYFFSVSGAMHNIIRKVPMFLSDRNDPGKLVYFYQGSGMQLGAEGFAIGFLYTVVGMILAFVTHVLVRVRNVAVQRGIMFVAMVVACWAVRKVIYLNNWKTGYSIHAFWPSSWN